MAVVIYILIALSLLTVLATLGLGLYGFTRGGALNSKWGNRLMGWRVKTQAVAVAVLMFGAWWVGAHRS